MADVATSLQKGLTVLQDIRVTGPTSSVRNQAAQLADKVQAEVARLQTTAGGVNATVEFVVGHHATKLQEAFDGGDFSAAIDHAAEMIGALPGDAQTGQRPPWQR